jgi:hypothetical protein
MERLEWVIEHEGDYDINPHELNKNLIDRSREKQGSYNFCSPPYLRAFRKRNLRQLAVQSDPFNALKHSLIGTSCERFIAAG